MGLSIEKRGNTRIHTRFETTYRVGPRQGIGVLSDLSLSGARVLHCSWLPDLTERVELRVHIHDEEAPLQVEGAVLRLAEGGFVVRFDKHQETLARVLDSLELSAEDLMGPDLLPGDAGDAGDAADAGDGAQRGSSASDDRLEDRSLAELETMAARIAAELERKRR